MRDDATMLEVTRPLFDGVYEFCRRAVLSGREPPEERQCRVRQFMSTVRAVAWLLLTVVRAGLPCCPRNYEH